MKNLLAQYAAYNLWANNALVESIAELPEEDQTRTVTSSFPSLHATLLHMWDAESIWWQRIKLQEQIIRPSETVSADVNAARKGLLDQSKQWCNWVQEAQPHMFEHEFIYRNFRRETFKQPVWQVLLHLFNHSTYHRGQLITLLRQLGSTTIPNTDFIAWTRNPK